MLQLSQKFWLDAKITRLVTLECVMQEIRVDVHNVHYGFKSIDLSIYKDIVALVKTCS